MKRLAIIALILGAWFCIPAHAQFNGCSSFCGTSSSAIADAPGFNNIQSSGSAPSNQTALDGQAQGASQSSGDLCTVTLTTTQTNDLIVLFTEANGVNSVTSVTDTAGLTWTARAIGGTVPNTPIFEYTAPAAAALSSDTISVVYDVGPGFCVAGAFGVSGYNTGSPFDGSPVTSTTDPVSITTTNANDFIVGLARVGVASPTQGSCCTFIQGANFMLGEYDKVTTTQSGLSVNIGTGVGTSNGFIAHAIKSR